MRRIIYIACSIFMLIIILLYPIQSFEGGKAGLNLWFQTMIPTLLPFIILSNIMVAINATDSLAVFLSPISKRLLRISKQSNYAIILGMLCGFPMGAKAVNDLIMHKKISKIEGQYLLNFCNNVSPMFIISFIIHTTLNQGELLGKFLIILYGSPIICAILLNYSFRKKSKGIVTNELTYQNNKNVDFKIVDTCIINSFETIMKIGGYLIMFSIISHFLMHFLEINDSIKALIVGCFEITTGINHIGTSNIPQFSKVLIICIITSFGGLATLAQTQSIIKESGLSLFSYFKSKILNTIIATIIALLIL